jgi:predicted DNA-binding protein (MmcQ/YjbR family)
MTPAKVHDDEETLRRHCLSYPAATEDFPWGHSAFKVKGKAFCFMSKAEAELSLSVKLPTSNSMALSFPFAEPTGYGLGKAGWVSATFPAGKRAPVALMKDWIDESYRAIAPVKLIAALDAPAAAAAAVISPIPPATEKGAAKKKGVKKPAGRKKMTAKTAKKAKKVRS